MVMIQEKCLLKKSCADCDLLKGEQGNVFSRGSGTLKLLMIRMTGS